MPVEAAFGERENRFGAGISVYPQLSPQLWIHAAIPRPMRFRGCGFKKPNFVRRDAATGSSILAAVAQAASRAYLT